MSHPYLGATATMTTKHEKVELVAPIFGRLGITVNEYLWDTDQLGTFSGEIPRKLGQRETAIEKARIGLKATGSNYGLASEGSIGADPFIPLINSAIEALAWIDLERGIELVEFERGVEIVAVKGELKSVEGLDELLVRADFPNHALIVYPKGRMAPIFKGIRGKEELLAALAESIRNSEESTAVVESDLRAHMSPSRQVVIRRCAERLVSRLENLCERCSLPGFGVIANLYGLPCEECGEENERALRGEVLGCVKCDLRVEQLNGKTSANPASCSSCNP